MATKYDLTGKRVGKLVIQRICTVDERPTKNHGNYWLCKCDCGNECKVPTTYLTGNSNYTQTSCGCDRKKKAFAATSYVNVSDEYLEKFNKQDFEKYLLLHKAFIRTTTHDLQYYNSHLEEYMLLIEHFWEDEQFNRVYNFWKKCSIEQVTFYDWAKPSLDHIVPLSKGGKDDLSNYQFLTTFENLSKRDMTMDEWNKFKRDTNTKSDYFIESIMA